MADPNDSGAGKRAGVAPSHPLPAAPRIAPLVPSIAPLVPPIAPVASSRVPPPPPKAAGLEALDASQLAALSQLCTTLDQRDYFQLLKVKQEAGPSEIKQAFYAESRAYHPDRFYHLSDKATKDMVNEIYKRVTEAYYVLRDDAKRKRYLVEINGPERAAKLRFTEASETESKQAVKKEQEEQIGTHPKGRQFFQTGMQDLEAERWSSAERNIKMALTYEPQNPRYREKLALVQQRLHEQFKKGSEQFKIK